MEGTTGPVRNISLQIIFDQNYEIIVTKVIILHLVNGIMVNIPVLEIFICRKYTLKMSTIIPHCCIEESLPPAALSCWATS